MTRSRLASLAALIVGLALAAPAHARDIDWPALFHVTGVDASDALNVRSAPRASAEIVGTFAANRAGIEVIRPNDDGTWGFVNVGEQSGWVSLSFLSRHDVAQTGLRTGIRQCFGTEPFWSLTFDPPRMTLNTPEIDPREGLISGQFTSHGRRDRFAFTGSFFPIEAGNRDVTMSVRLEACNDGMSDREYGIGFDMLITRPDLEGDRSVTGLYSGCCTISPPPEE